MVFFGIGISLVPPQQGAWPTRRRWALFLAFASSVFWLISELESELRMPRSP